MWTDSVDPDEYTEFLVDLLSQLKIKGRLGQDLAAERRRQKLQIDLNAKLPGITDADRAAARARLYGSQSAPRMRTLEDEPLGPAYSDQHARAAVIRQRAMHNKHLSPPLRMLLNARFGPVGPHIMPTPPLRGAWKNGSPSPIKTPTGLATSPTLVPAPSMMSPMAPSPSLAPQIAPTPDGGLKSAGGLLTAPPRMANPGRWSDNREVNTLTQQARQTKVRMA